MIFGSDRTELRQMYVDAWRKHTAGGLMNPLEAQIADVIADHPEYHPAVTGDPLTDSYSPDDGKTNPFLHMGLHLALREQVSTNRPQGIAEIQRQLAQQTGDRHVAEHQMLEALAETLWEAQRDGNAPDEQKYLERLRSLR